MYRDGVEDIYGVKWYFFYPPSVPLWGRRLSGEVLFPLAAGRSPSGVGWAVAVRGLRGGLCD